jgi:hypothetical protein
MPARTDDYASALAGIERPGNSMLFACVDELLERIGRGEKRSARLESPAMGKWEDEE